MRHTRHILCIVGFALALGVDPSHAQDRGNSNWYVRVAPYLWYSNLGGAHTLGAGSDEQIFGNVVVPVEDTLLERSWEVRLEFGKGPVRVWTNLSRAHIADDAILTNVDDEDDTTDGSFDLAWYTGEFYAALQVGSFVETHAIEVYAGARYTRLEQTLTAGGSTTPAVTETWVDPVIGSRFFMEMGRRSWATFNGDVGGFGVGSQFTWSMGGELGLRVVPRFFDITLRYHYQEVEYDNGKTNTETFIWNNGVRQGWFLGAVFKL